MSHIKCKSGVKYVEGKSVQSFFSSAWQWKSAKWKETERLIRRSRFWCSGSNENQMTSTIIHLRPATPSEPVRLSCYIEMAVKRLGIQASAEAQPPCVKYGE